MSLVSLSAWSNELGILDILTLTVYRMNLQMEISVRSYDMLVWSPCYRFYGELAKKMCQVHFPFCTATLSSKMHWEEIYVVLLLCPWKGVQREETKSPLQYKLSESSFFFQWFQISCSLTKKKRKLSNLY